MFRKIRDVILKRASEEYFNPDKKDGSSIEGAIDEFN